MRLTQRLAPILDLIFPPRCPTCGEGLSAQSGLCGSCWSELAIPGEPCCKLCQRPFPDSMNDNAGLCAPCMARPPQHDGIAAGTLYNEQSRKLVLAFKHGRRIALTPLLARLMAARLPAAESADDWIVVPVPLHRWRLWHRGFNQAALLGCEVARLRDMRQIVDALHRRRRTPSLGGMGAKARARAIAGAIMVNPRRAAALDGARVVLVDDVLTSGATTGACVTALKRAGARQVVICCFARVLDEAL